jgi:hypothetical protein
MYNQPVQIKAQQRAANEQHKQPATNQRNTTTKKQAGEHNKQDT